MALLQIMKNTNGEIVINYPAKSPENVLTDLLHLKLIVGTQANIARLCSLAKNDNGARTVRPADGWQVLTPQHFKKYLITIGDY